MTEQAGSDNLPDAEPTAASIAADTLGRDVLSAMVDELRAMPTHWDSMTQTQQENAIHRLNTSTRRIVSEVLGILFRGDYPACPATVDSVKFKDGITVTLKLAKTEHHRHEVADAEGQTVIIVMSNPDEYFARMEEVKAKRQQPDLFEEGGGLKFGENYTGGVQEPGRRVVVGSEDLDLETLTLDMGPLHEQALDMLRALACQVSASAGIALGLHVDAEVAKRWTDTECQQIAGWILHVRTLGVAEDGANWLPCPVLVPLELELEGSQQGLALDEPWQQCQSALMRVGVIVPDGIVKFWTEDQMVQAVCWATAYAEDQTTSVERPGFLLPPGQQYPDDVQPVQPAEAVDPAANLDEEAREEHEAESSAEQQDPGSAAAGTEPAADAPAGRRPRKPRGSAPA